MTREEILDFLLNRELSRLADDRPDQEFAAPKVLKHNGKNLPYLGWYWRPVDFECITLGDAGEFIGFMEDNKWRYEERYLTKEQSGKLREACIAFALEPTTETCAAIYELVNSFWRERGGSNA